MLNKQNYFIFKGIGLAKAKELQLVKLKEIQHPIGKRRILFQYLTVAL